MLAVAVLGATADVLGVGSARLVAATAFAALGGALGFALLATRGLEVRPPAPSRPFVGERVALTFGVRSARLAPLFDLTWTLEGNERTGLHVDEVAAGAERSIELVHRFAQRGRHTRIALAASTARPFGLIRTRAELVLALDVVAVPRPLPLAFTDPPAGSARLDLLESLRSGDDEFYTLRDWRVGESPRRIHWKATAKRGRRVRIESRRRAARPALVVLSLRVPRGASSGLFERALRVAAGLGVRALAARRPLRLVLLGPGGIELGPLAGRADRMRLLETLALAQSSPGDPREELRDWLARHPHRDPPEVVFIGDDEPTPPGWIDVRDVLAAGRPTRARRLARSAR